MAKRPKYGNRKTVVEGITFDSIAESKRYRELKLLERGKEINQLELQKKYDLHALDGSVIARYKADFDYFDLKTRQHVTEDVKGMVTPIFRIKAKLFRAEYGREISIVRRK